MNTNPLSMSLRNSQGNLFLKSDIVSKLMHIMNPIRGESKQQLTQTFCRRDYFWRMEMSVLRHGHSSLRAPLASQSQRYAS